MWVVEDREERVEEVEEQRGKHIVVRSLPLPSIERALGFDIQCLCEIFSHALRVLCGSHCDFP